MDELQMGGKLPGKDAVFRTLVGGQVGSVAGVVASVGHPRYLSRNKAGLRGRPRLAGYEIGVTRFTRRPAMLQTPSLDLAEEHEGGLTSFLVLNRHSEKSDAQFV